MPAHFNQLSCDLIKKLLVVDSKQRLGCMKHGVDDIKNHPWFSGLDWKLLHLRTKPGPLNPNVTTEGDTHNFYRYSEDGSTQETPLDEDVDLNKFFSEF
jgi:hypothetical protein